MPLPLVDPAALGSVSTTVLNVQNTSSQMKRSSLIGKAKYINGGVKLCGSPFTPKKRPKGPRGWAERLNRVEMH